LVSLDLLDHLFAGIDQPVDAHSGLVRFRNPPATLADPLQRTVVTAFHKSPLSSGGRKSAGDPACRCRIPCAKIVFKTSMMEDGRSRMEVRLIMGIRQSFSHGWNTDETRI